MFDRESTRHICVYGLYASMNAEPLRELGADTIIGGEFEEPLSTLPPRRRPLDHRA